MATSGLIENNDFAADLVLNKVMNGVYRTQNGNTLTMAGRINASKLDSDSVKMNVEAETVRRGKEKSEAAIDLMSSLQKEIENFNKAYLGAGGNTTAIIKAATQAKTNIDELVKTQFDGQSVVNETKSVGLGHGAGALTVGQVITNDAAFAAVYGDITGAIAAGAIGTAYETHFDDAVSALLSCITVESMRANTLSNRYDVFNDMAASYKEASNDQVVTEGGNATSLLNRLIG